MANNSVLIVDDDIWMQRILSKTLQSYGFNVTYLASNGLEGIALAVEHQPTLIIMDILMPELSGHLTLKILKKIKTTRHIPVLMASALSDTENLSLAVQSGTDGFITKPFTRATVYEKLISIFGKEKLEMITRGESIDKEMEYINNVNYNINSAIVPDSIDINENAAADVNNKPSQASFQPRIPPGQLLHHYQEDEKKNIEMIKKLLLKTKL